MFHPTRKVRKLAEAELRRARVVARGAAVRAVIYLAAAGLVLMAVGWGVVAVFLVLSQAYGAPAGAIITGAGVLFLGLLLALLARPLSGGQRQRMAEEAARAARADLADDIDQLETLLRGLKAGSAGWAQGKGTSFVVCALVAGIAVGMSSRLRRLLLGRDD